MTSAWDTGRWADNNAFMVSAQNHRDRDNYLETIRGKERYYYLNALAISGKYEMHQLFRARVNNFLKIFDQCRPLYLHQLQEFPQEKKAFVRRDKGDF